VLAGWVAEIAGTHEEWDAEIVDQVPDQRIAWRATTGTTNDGIVSFESLGANSTRVTLDLDVEPEGLKEKIGRSWASSPSRSKVTSSASRSSSNPAAPRPAHGGAGLSLDHVGLGVRRPPRMVVAGGAPTAPPHAGAAAGSLPIS